MVRPSTEISPEFAAHLVSEAKLAVTELEISTPTTLDKALTYLETCDEAISLANPPHAALAPVIKATMRRQARLRELHTSFLNDPNQSDDMKALRDRYLRAGHASTTEHLLGLCRPWLAQLPLEFETFRLRHEWARSLKCADIVMNAITSQQVRTVLGRCVQTC